METYDVFCVPPKKPAIGDKKEECIAVVEIRNSAGNIIRWHCLCTKEQAEYHLANGAKGFYADRAFVGKSITVKIGGNDVVKISPAHSFAGNCVRDANKIYTGAEGPDIDTTPGLPI